MRQFLRHVVPSMFHRRLMLLSVVMVFGVVALVARLSVLTLAQADELRLKAEAALSQRKVIPTLRGRIRDRYGRVLAQSRASYQVAVRYPVLTGAWAHRRARYAAWRQNRNEWAEFSELTREELAKQYEPEYLKQVTALKQTLCVLGHIDHPELDRRIETIKSRVQRVAGLVWVRRLQRESEKSEKPVTFTDVSKPIGEQLSAHAMLDDVDDEGLLLIQRLIADNGDQRDSVWRHVEVKPSKVREYPLESMTIEVDRSTLPGHLKSNKPIEAIVEGVGMHIVGWMRSIYREDVDERPFRLPASAGGPFDLGGYLPGDQAGRNGIEASMEDQLRGNRGVVTEYLDTKTQKRLEPTAGNDVVLTIDIRLQARIQALMDASDKRIGLMQTQPWHAKDIPASKMGQSLNGAAVVLDVATGQVLAAVSAPGFSMKQMRDNPASIYKDDFNKPYLFRPVGSAVGGVYQPGSTLKPIVLASAITDRMIGPHAPILCTGHLDADSPTRFRCWIYKHFNRTHGPLAGDEALARSCNIFFYTLGRRLGGPRLSWWYDQFGLGQKAQCGLDESAGELPNWKDADNPNARGFSQSESILLGIGQGPVRWTPLQAANAYATIAREGHYMSPTFVIAPQSRPRVTRDLRLDKKAIDVVMKGLKDAANERHGTAHHLSMLKRENIFNVPDVTVYGKSGTATAVPQRVDSDGDGRITRKDKIVRSGDHAWFIGMVKKPRPGNAKTPRADYVIAVVVEYAGSGGAVAGPIANQIMHAMRAEGHL